MKDLKPVTLHSMGEIASAPQQFGRQPYSGSLDMLGPGQKLTIHHGTTPEHPVALEITSDPDSASFVVRKLPQGSGIELPEAQQWEIPTDTTTLGETGVFGLLLGPSVLGKSLFGGIQSPGSDIEHSFGTITRVYDGYEQVHLVDIEMPWENYRNLGALTVVVSDITT